MFRSLAVLTAAAIASGIVASAQARPYERLDALRLVEHDFLREDSRVFVNREGGEHVEASLELRDARYRLQLQRTQHHEFLLVIESRDGARCPGRQIIVVGTRTGQLYQGVCEASIAVNFKSDRAYYEAELDRLLRLFQPLLAPHAPKFPEAS